MEHDPRLAGPVPVAFAIGMLLVPFTLPRGRTVGQAWTTIEMVALFGIAAGWLFGGRALAFGVPRWVQAGPRQRRDLEGLASAGRRGSCLAGRTRALRGSGATDGGG